MRTFEYSVTPTMVDKLGHATIASMYKCVANATNRMMAPGDSWILLSSSLEVDERPKLDDLFNILVFPQYNKSVTSFNAIVLLTDSEGEEIGRAQSEWQRADSGHSRPLPPERYVKEFFNRLPEELKSTALQTKIELECHGSVHSRGNVTFNVERALDDRFIFHALSSGKTLCRATLETS